MGKAFEHGDNALFAELLATDPVEGGEAGDSRVNRRRLIACGFQMSAPGFDIRRPDFTRVLTREGEEAAGSALCGFSGKPECQDQEAHRSEPGVDDDADPGAAPPLDHVGQD